MTWDNTSPVEAPVPAPVQQVPVIVYDKKKGVSFLVEPDGGMGALPQDLQDAMNIDSAHREETSKNPFGMTDNQMELFKMCARDKYGAAMPSFLRIRDKHGKLVPFIPTEIHLKFVRTRKRKSFVLKPRQVYFTSFMEADYFLDAVLGDGIRVLFINMDARVTEEVFDRVHVYRDNFKLPEIMPQIKRETTKKLSWHNGSSYDAVTAKNDDGEEAAKMLGRSCTQQRVHVTEGHYLKHYDAFMHGLNDSIPVDGWLVVETTGNGAQGGFYEDFMSIKENGTEVEPGVWVLGDQSAHFFQWWEHPEYIMDEDPLLTTELTAEQSRILAESEEDHRKEMAKTPGVAVEKRLYWRRWWLLNKKSFSRDPERAIAQMDQEYPATVEMAFQSSSHGFFPSTLLHNRREYWKAENQRRRLPLMCRMSSGQPYPGGDVRIWVPPYDREKEEWTNRYCIGVDCGGGHEDGDSDVIIVKDRHLNMYVSIFHGNYGPDLIMPELLGLGRYYHNARIAVEANNMGVAVQIALYKANYPNLYYTNPDAEDYKGIGVVTTGKNKNTMLQNLYLKFTEERKELRIPYLQWYSEAAAFGRKKGSTRLEAQGGAHDDLIMASAITELCDSSMPPPEIVSMGNSRLMLGFDSSGGKQASSVLHNGW